MNHKISFIHVIHVNILSIKTTFNAIFSLNKCSLIFPLYNLESKKWTFFKTTLFISSLFGIIIILIYFDEIPCFLTFPCLMRFAADPFGSIETKETNSLWLLVMILNQSWKLSDKKIICSWWANSTIFPWVAKLLDSIYTCNKERVNSFPYSRNHYSLLFFSTIDVICCACKCHRKLGALKEEKLKLQIKYYKRKLVEE